MRFLFDRDVPADLAVALRTVGHDAMRLVEVLVPNASDQEVWVDACARQLILITCNRDDFLALAKATEIHPGLIILTRRRTRQAEASHVLTLLKKAGPQGLGNNINFA